MGRSSFAWWFAGVTLYICAHGADQVLHSCVPLKQTVDGAACPAYAFCVTTSTHAELSARLEERFDALSPQMKKAALYVMERPAAVAAETLLVASHSASFFHSILPMLALIQALIALLAARGGDKALAALAHAEQQLEWFHVYWPRGGTGRRG